MVKVLYVADTFLPKRDGVVRFMLETAKRFSKDVEVSFLVPDFPGAREEAEKRKLKATFCPIMRFKIADYPPTTPKGKIISEAIKDADIVCVQSVAPLGAAAIMQAKKQKKKLAEFIHSIDWKLLAYGTRFPERVISVLKSAARFLYSKNDLLIAADKYVKDVLIGNGIKVPIKIVPLGVDNKKFKKDPAKRVWMRKDLGLEGCFVIGYLGRLSAEKNIPMLLKTLCTIKKKIPKAKLLLIGGGAQEKLVKNKKGVILTGFVENPEDYLQAVDVFVLPSKTETTALSLMEAMSIGLPIVASSVGAIPSYVMSGHNGILIAQNSLSAQMIANAVEIIYTSPQLKVNLAKNAEQTIQKFYNWDKTAAELEKVFKDLAKK